jgi:hypothetical protein
MQLLDPGGVTAGEEGRGGRQLGDPFGVAFDCRIARVDRGGERAERRDGLGFLEAGDVGIIGLAFSRSPGCSA